MFVPPVRGRSAGASGNAHVLRIEVPPQLPLDHVVESIALGMRRLWDGAVAAAEAAGGRRVSGTERPLGAWTRLRAEAADVRPPTGAAPAEPPALGPSGDSPSSAAAQAPSGDPSSSAAVQAPSGDPSGDSAAHSQPAVSAPRDDRQSSAGASAECMQPVAPEPKARLAADAAGLSDDAPAGAQAPETQDAEIPAGETTMWGSRVIGGNAEGIPVDHADAPRATAWDAAGLAAGGEAPGLPRAAGFAVDASDGTGSGPDDFPPEGGGSEAPMESGGTAGSDGPTDSAGAAGTGSGSDESMGAPGGTGAGEPLVALDLGTAPAEIRHSGVARNAGVVSAPSGAQGANGAAAGVMDPTVVSDEATGQKVATVQSVTPGPAWDAAVMQPSEEEQAADSAATDPTASSALGAGEVTQAVQPEAAQPAAAAAALEDGEVTQAAQPEAAQPAAAAVALGAGEVTQAAQPEAAQPAQAVAPPAVSRDQAVPTTELPQQAAAPEEPDARNASQEEAAKAMGTAPAHPRAGGPAGRPSGSVGPTTVYRVQRQPSGPLPPGFGAFGIRRPPQPAAGPSRQQAPQAAPQPEPAAAKVDGEATQELRADAAPQAGPPKGETTVLRTAAVPMAAPLPPGLAPGAAHPFREGASAPGTFRMPGAALPARLGTAPQPGRTSAARPYQPQRAASAADGGAQPWSQPRRAATPAASPPAPETHQWRPDDADAGAEWSTQPRPADAGAASTGAPADAEARVSPNRGSADAVEVGTQPVPQPRPADVADAGSSTSGQTSPPVPAVWAVPPVPTPPQPPAPAAPPSPWAAPHGPRLPRAFPQAPQAPAGMWSTGPRAPATAGDSGFRRALGGGWVPAVAPMVGPRGPNAQKLVEANVLVPFR